MTGNIDYSSTVWLEARLDAERAVPEILTSLRLLGSSPPENVVNLTRPDLAPVVDNLRGTFANVAELIPTLVVEEYISPRQAIAIQAVQLALGSLPGDASAQTNSDGVVQAGSEWELVRRAALRALDELNALAPARPRTSCPD